MTATTFLVTDIMGNFALERITVSAIAENVLAIHSGIAQVYLLFEIIIGGFRNEFKLFKQYFNLYRIKHYIYLFSGYTACECRASNDTCITPYGEFLDQLCSGHGTCCLLYTSDAADE